MKKNRPKYNQIIDAAIKVIAENGFHKAQVSKIAKAAGVADGTIYLYFKNKEDILITMFREKINLFIENLESAIQFKDNAIEKLYTLIHMYFKEFSKNKHLAIVIQLELRQSNIEMREEINNILKPYLAIIDSIIEEGVKEKSFRDDLKIPFVRQMIFGTLNEIITAWVMKDCSYPLMDEVDKIHQLITVGVCRIKK